jgi:hypothetical protein
MQLTLTKKNDPCDKQPLIIHMDYQDKPYTQRVALGETIEVEDQLGYQIMSTYPKLFTNNTAGYKTKTMHPEGK